eukprot:scaffold54111_cov45-Phaeocystis_antarctica.AAC.1
MSGLDPLRVWCPRPRPLAGTCRKVPTAALHILPVRVAASPESRCAPGRRVSRPRASVPGRPSGRGGCPSRAGRARRPRPSARAALGSRARRRRRRCTARPPAPPRRSAAAPRRRGGTRSPAAARR